MYPHAPPRAVQHRIRRPQTATPPIRCPTPRPHQTWPLHTARWICSTSVKSAAVEPLEVDTVRPLPRDALSTKAGRQSTLGYAQGSSLSVDGAQATNLMVTQDTDKVFLQVRPPCGRNTYALRLIVLLCIVLSWD